MPSNLSRAYVLFQTAARELQIPDALTPEELAAKLRSASQRVLDTLEGKVGSQDGETDAFSKFEEQSRDIADDLRRVERLMKRHIRGD